MHLVQLKEIMGHKRISSTMLYVKMSPKALGESLNRLALFWRVKRGRILAVPNALVSHLILISRLRLC